MPSIKSILKMSLVTLIVIFVANQTAGVSPLARRVLKGGLLAPVGSTGNAAKETYGVWV